MPRLRLGVVCVHQALGDGARGEPAWPVENTRAERAETYRALLDANHEPSMTKRLVRGGIVGLAVLGAAGWLLQRTMREKNGETPTSGPDPSASA